MNILKLLTKNAKEVSPTAVVDSGKDIFSEYISYLKLSEEEITKRRCSEHLSKVNIENIRAQKEVLLAAIKADYKSKKIIIDKTFERIDLALESGDTTSLNLLLSALVETSKSSSIRELSKLVNDLQNPRTAIDI